MVSLFFLVRDTSEIYRTEHKHRAITLVLGGQNHKAKRRLDVLIGVWVAKPTDLLNTKLHLENFVVRWTSLLSALEGSPVPKAKRRLDEPIGVYHL